MALRCPVTLHWPAAQVAFARIVIAGRKKSLAPPPLNLLREAVDLSYVALTKLVGFCCCCFAGGLGNNGSIESSHTRLVEGDEEPASGGGSSADSSLEEWACQCVHEYTSKALAEAQGERGTLSDQIVHFVTTRWFGIGREETWRTDMTGQIGRVELALDALERRIESVSNARKTRDEALAESIERRVSALLHRSQRRQSIQALSPALSA